MLKKTIYIFLFTTCFISIKAQTNLVPNPSFEIYDTCPNTDAYIRYALPWYPASSDLPNYFNACSTTSSFSVPDNIGGYSYAASGNAYAGITVYEQGSPATLYSEIMGAPLTTTLTVGQKYYVKLKLVCAIGGQSNTAANNVGVRFTRELHNSTINTTPINNFADVYATSIVTDTTNWTQIFGSFVADSAYPYIEVGNFFDYSHTNTQVIKPWGSDNYSFYFIDDICVSTDSAYTQNWVWTTGIEQFTNKEEQVMLYPNPSSDGYFHSSVNFNNTPALVYDVLGNIVKHTLINKNVIDLNDLQNGIYIVEIINEEYRTKQKLIINK